MTTPNRTKYVVDLIRMIADAANAWADGDRRPANENLILAMCEVAVSLPPEWFAPAERLLIVKIVDEIYGNARKFLDDINDDSISFYAKYAAANGLPTDGLMSIMASLLRSHEREFGTLT